LVAGRIVLFGATGYTGALTARAMVRRGERPVLAGRDAARLEALARELGGLETRVADAAAPATLAGLATRGDVLVSTAGPFARLGEPVVRAAVAAGAHYLDSTGETAFVRRVFEVHGPDAERAGCTLLPAFGFEFVPGNLAGALALSRAGDAARVEIGYFVTGRGFAASGGTRASAVGILTAPVVAWRDGRLVEEPVGQETRAFDLGEQPGCGRAGAGRVRAVSAGGSEPFALPRIHPGLRDVRVYLGLGRASPAIRALALAAAAAARLPGVRRSLDAVAARAASRTPAAGDGAAARASSGCLVIAHARPGRDDGPVTVRLAGPNPYDLTAELLAWGAGVAARGGVARAGAAGPVDGFGLAALRQGCEAAGLVPD
jgi:short subunit dehydrogenase-like uncharacterized protein